MNQQSIRPIVEGVFEAFEASEAYTVGDTLKVFVGWPVVVDNEDHPFPLQKDGDY